MEVIVEETASKEVDDHSMVSALNEKEYTITEDETV
jgi:hypothetical protein